jgi:hypothetical protein
MFLGKTENGGNKYCDLLDNIEIWNFESSYMYMRPAGGIMPLTLIWYPP